MEHALKMNMTSLGGFKLEERKIASPESMRACQDYGKTVGKML
jgi:hypothetical protein